MQVKRVLLTALLIAGFIFVPYYVGALFGLVFIGSLPPTVILGWFVGAIALVVVSVVCKIAWDTAKNILG